MTRCRTFSTKPFPSERYFRNTDDVLMVNTLSDLSPYLSGTEYVLPSKLVVVLSSINIGDRTVRLSTDTVLWGAAKGAFVSTTTDALLTCSSLDSSVIVREINLVAPVGSCIDLSGPIDQQLNLFFVGMIGATAGTITGFDVQSVKQCYIQCANGITNTGTTNKVFYSETPFYAITGSAITLGSGLVASVADIVTSFFKFDAPGVGLTAEAGYTVTDGVFRGSLIDGTATPLSGLTPADTNWSMDQNTGVRDSVIAGLSSLSSSTTVPIATMGDYVQVTGTFSLASVSERFVLTVGTNELEYTGRYPALVEISIPVAVDPANNDRVAFRATVNGADIAESTVIVEQGAGPGSSPRGATVIALSWIEIGDTIGVAGANLEASASFDLLACNIVVRG